MSLNNKFLFGQRSVAALPCPTDGKYFTYYDTQLTGLSLRVYPSQKKVFYLYKKILGRPERMKLGEFGTINVQQARELANNLNLHIVQGINPMALRQEARRELTLAEFFDIYMERHAKAHKRSWANDERYFQSHMLHWRRSLLSNIQRNEIITWHLKLGKERGKYAANHSLTPLRTLYNKAIEWEFFNSVNPCKGVKKFQEKSRERFIQPNEMIRFFEAVNELRDRSSRDFFLMCLYTGARKSNVLSMRWKDIDMNRHEWNISMTKNGTAQTIPLIDAAINLLKERHQTAVGEWIFPSSLNSTGHLVEPRGSWETIRKIAGLEDLRMHDLRRSLGSWQARTGASLVIIGKTLNHQSPQSTQIYARLDNDPVRQAMETAVTAMMDAAKVKK
jgi:integrase